MAAAKSTRREGGEDGFDPSNTQNRIEVERRRLQKASAVLTALVYSLNHEALDTYQAGDVADIALDLIEQAILALDVVELTKDAPAHPSS